MASSLSAATLLDFGASTVTNSNLADGDTAASGGNIRWANIATVDIDLIAEVTGGTYSAANTDNNGLNGDFGQININSDSSL